MERAGRPLVGDAAENGNFLLAGGGAVREVNRRRRRSGNGLRATTPEYPMTNLQLATRLPNGNTIINNWFQPMVWRGSIPPTRVQAIEVTPDKKVVWVLRSWTEPADLDRPPRSRSSISLASRERAGLP